MSSRLILKLEIDGKTHRNVRMWVPDGEQGIQIFDFALRLLSTLHGVLISYQKETT